MTVRDHLMVADAGPAAARAGCGATCATCPGRSAEEIRPGRRRARAGRASTDRADTPGLGPRASGSCRLVELARALVGRAALLMADEPSSGLDVHETARAGRGAPHRSNGERGMAMLLVEHDLAMVAEVVDRAVVMDLGRGHRRGRLRRRSWPTPTCRRAYLGMHGVTTGTAAGRRRPDAGPGGRTAGPALEVRRVGAGLRPLPGALRRVLRGARRRGRRADRLQRRRQVDGGPGGLRSPGHDGGDRCGSTVRDVTGWPAYKLARAGMAHVPEGRGVFASLTVEENLKLAFRQRGGRKGGGGLAGPGLRGLPPPREPAEASAAAPCPGGQQRLLSLAKVLVVPPQVLVADEISPRAGPGDDRRRLRGPAARSTRPAPRC